MSNTNHVTLAAIHPNDLEIILCKSCNKLIATLPTDGYKKALWSLRFNHLY